MPQIKWSKLCHSASIPKSAYDGDVCFDIKSSMNITISPNQTVAVSTGLRAILPEGYGALLHERSGNALKKQLAVCGGVIDNGYRGEWKVIVRNDGLMKLNIKVKDKIAQGRLVYLYDTIHEEIGTEEFNNEQTSRDKSGFGSTGD